MARTHSSRTPLSTQTSVLRASLLLSLGLAPLACGGTAITPSDGDGGSSSHAGAGDAGGAPSYAGGNSEGGTPSFAGTGAVGGASPLVDCPNPVFNPTTKLTSCSNGRSHRVEAIECSSMPPGEGGTGGAGEADPPSAGAAGAPSLCTSNSDCSSLGPYGFCDFGEGGLVAPTCQLGCVKDSDCRTGAVCACNGSNLGRCVAANCVTDADCGANSLCAPASGICGPSSFQCTSTKDECISNDDCGGRACAFNGEYRACSGAVCGRPFLIENAPRMAAVEARADWLDATLTPNPTGLSPVQRAQLAAHWARLGQMEHASIAAFARFNLQLLSLGAPGELLEACNRALADETAHARACFALASAYGRTPVGPARLDIEHCFEDTSLTAIAKLVLREGCLGETVASLEALAAAEVARDPAVKRALTKIARDELSHAELAFKFLRWVLASTPVEVRDELAREAEQQLADFENDARNAEPTLTDERLAEHGLLAADALRQIHLAAVRDVSRPLLAALFDAEESSHA